MSSYKRKPKKDSLLEIIDKYSHDNQACIDFFFHVKWPTGFYCEKCGCTHYYFIKDRNVFECPHCHHIKVKIRLPKLLQISGYTLYQFR